MMLAPFAPFLLAVSAQGTLPAGVYVVAQNLEPGVDFTSIGDAVTTAGSGSTILVFSGGALLVPIEGKSLDIVRVPGTVTNELLSDVVIRDLSPTQRVTLQGFTEPNFQGGTLVENCAGPVWIADLPMPSLNTTLGYTFRATNCTSVDLVDCSIESGNTASGGVWVGTDVRDGSTVRFHGCNLLGEGGLGLFKLPFALPAARVSGGSTLIGHDTEFLTEDETAGFPSEWAAAPAIEAEDGSQVFVRASSLVPGLMQPDIELDASSTAQEVVALPRSVDAQSPVRAGDPAQFDLTGEPLQPAFLGISFEPTGLLNPVTLSVLSLANPVQLLGVVPLDAAGQGSLVLGTALPVGLQALTVFAQMAQVDSAGLLAIGSPDILTVYDVPYDPR